MNFYRERVYPHLVRALGNPKPIAEIRQRILPLAQGEVLEIGVGSGVNFEHYDPTRVHKVYALEPNRGMMRLADEQRLKTRLQVEFIDLPGEQIPLADGTIDTVVSTFTLCTIPGVVDALKGLRKVLKPQGKFIFFEHGLAPDASVQQWQRRAEPLFRWAFEGCHVTRDIPRLISEAGFKIDMIENGYLAPFPKSGSYCWWGTAVGELLEDSRVIQASS
ncbi:MAG TPA: class I SAM-dependent methyltransferase [Terriglobales bacterium]|jgi:ubiquinone/menaquinone biosynthesis C-methylase UbiE|nr:class I SAM-dependent methyltransferase [Terriglobales bacterium]